MWRPPDPVAYCYLLGAYLGDGTVLIRGNSFRLQVVTDRRYPGLENEILRAMAVTFPGARPRSYKSSTGESDVLCVTHVAICHGFPQHGPGRKHLRHIELQPWQLQLTHRHPGSLIRGLIHSDGCRAVNRFRTRLPSGRLAEYAYVRYFFSNRSADILQIFIDHCELLDIRVTRSNARNLSVAHRDSVALLEDLVGPKN